MTVREAVLPAETEAQFQRRVLKLARVFGWATYHTRYSWGSTAGFPDLVLVRERVLFRELKSDRGKLTDAQRNWIVALSMAGADAAVWQPANWEKIERQLKGEAGDGRRRGRAGGT